ncbi:PREDICTED: U6 snRNA phosphodiesterase [Nicrophorus vespilloides]|uniref:U6 snRNA phosphodiesterase n=1 Tax=Nicrophorus vespilloides TaxID=110193 RepID=A0ABM1NDD6_NICVS|nr:PREDICTED: U6 snRNA phosphodiesterase [Nicrophorus vespilloides]
MEYGALSLLSIYGDDDSEDESVPGPKVSTKRCFRDDEETPYNFKRLAVPDIIINGLKAETHSDNPSMHNGRLRSFPHVRGNWSTFLSIPFETGDDFENLTESLRSAVNEIELNVETSPHISVSKTVVLRHHWIKIFSDSIREKLNVIKKFIILFDCLKVYCNEERTRTFLGLQIKSGYESLVKIVSQVDECLADFKLTKFYEDPSFHMSILWCVGDKEDELNRALPRLNEVFAEQVNVLENNYINADKVLCKCGNKIFSYALS